MRTGKKQKILIFSPALLIQQGFSLYSTIAAFKMEKVILKPLQHCGQECIGIYFENTAVINGAIRKNAGARWSRTNKCWYVLLSKESYNKLFLALAGKAVIEQTELYAYMAEKKKTSPDKKMLMPGRPPLKKIQGLCTVSR